MYWTISDRPSAIDQDPTHPHPDAQIFSKQVLRLDVASHAFALVSPHWTLNRGAGQHHATLGTGPEAIEADRPPGSAGTGPAGSRFQRDLSVSEPTRCHQGTPALRRTSGHES